MAVQISYNPRTNTKIKTKAKIYTRTMTKPKTMTKTETIRIMRLKFRKQNNTVYKVKKQDKVMKYEYY